MASSLASNTVYTRPVAKVMISIADDLLERIDAQAKANRETRSGFLQRLAERAIAEESATRRRELEELLGPPVDLGGNAAELIRQSRDSR
jgi:HicB_like antitoxin of bacterial toxin-antitoxin system